MPACQLVSAQHGIIAWSKNADGDTAGLVVLIAIRVRRSMEPTGRGVVSNIGRPIPIVGVQATITLSKGLLGLRRTNCSSHPIPSVPDLDL
jgi:hypothetical protein